jgi:hypothetical protein
VCTREDIGMTARFTPDDSVVGVDDDTGDVVVYSGGGVASHHRGKWLAGMVFNRHDLFSRDSRFGRVDDPATVQRYLDAAHDALIESVELES